MFASLLRNAISRKKRLENLPCIQLITFLGSWRRYSQLKTQCRARWPSLKQDVSWWSVSWCYGGKFRILTLKNRSWNESFKFYQKKINNLSKFFKQTKKFFALSNSNLFTISTFFCHDFPEILIGLFIAKVVADARIRFEPNLFQILQRLKRISV